MIKYLEVPDFHYDPKWNDICIENGKSVRQAAIDNNVDIIVCPGDFYNSHLIATTKGGLTVAIKIIKSWLSVCPVCAIEGTPSHDGPGSYTALEECGLVLLRPGKTYGLLDGRIEKLPVEERVCTKAVLFGIPELNKRNIQGKLSLPAEQANAEAVKLFSDYIESFIAPERKKYEEVPAIGLLHGVVSDTGKDSSNDSIVKSSDIVIKTDVLARAMVDRWSLGHLHTPWESKKISAGYAGSWGLSWNETGFLPCFNYVRIDKRMPEKIRIERIACGTPQREKINTIEEVGLLNENVAYWLETDDQDAKLPDTVHPWSRVTHRVKKQESRRITKEQADAVKTLSDLFLLYDPDVSQSIIKKIDQIEKDIPAHVSDGINVKLQSIEIQGCDFWNGKKISFNLESLPSMILLMGDNGEGKSALVSFCTPYPIIVGKDTKSGRTSAIKDFFSGRDSMIKKNFIVNGKEHKHMITLKGAHTENCKVECYLSVDGISQLEIGTFDEMMAECEKLYGPYEDYILTTFYVQPLQGKTGSSLMSATLTEIRNLVQSIAGVDREKEKRYALNKKQEIDETVKEIQNWLKGAESFYTDPTIFQKKINDLVSKKEYMETYLEEIIEKGKQNKKQLDEAIEKKKINDEQISQKKHDNERIETIEKEIAESFSNIELLQKVVNNADALKAQYKAVEEKEIALTENGKMKLAYDESVMMYNRDLESLQSKVRKENERKGNEYREATILYENKRRNIKTEIENATSEINRLDKPCVNCGYIDPDSVQKIKASRKKIEECNEYLTTIETPILPVYEAVPSEIDKTLPMPPKYKEVSDVDGNIYELQKQIEETTIAVEKIKMIKESINKLSDELSILKNRIYVIDYEIDKTVLDLEEKRMELLNQHGELKAEIVSLETTIKSEKELLTKALNIRDQIKTKQKEKVRLEGDFSDWKYIAAQLQSAKIPAMELDIILDSIDDEATKNIVPYTAGR